MANSQQFCLNAVNVLKMSSLIQPSSSAGPSCKNVLAKGVLDILCMVLLLMPMAYIYVFSSHYDPFQRGFFCDDQNLKHPYLPQTVPIVQCVLIWAVVSVFFIVLVETLRSMAHAQSGTRRTSPIPGSKTPWIAVELYRHFGYFSLGALTCLLFTELSKYSIGRLRPHYLTLCMPNMQCCQNHITTWQTLANLQNGLLLQAFLGKSRPLADQNGHF